MAARAGANRREVGCLVELLWGANAGDAETCEHIVRLTKDVTNKSPVHTPLLLYKARALAARDMHTAARDALTTALRRRKGRPSELIHALRYERASVYGVLGHAKRARSDLAKSKTFAARLQPDLTLPA